MIIGLSGKAGAGKDTLGAKLIHICGFERAAFADPLKRACRDVFGLTSAQLYGAEKETLDPYWQRTPRDLLQRVGVALREAVAPDVWVKATMRELATRPHAEWVITDVRFPNEADAVKAAGGYVVRIERPGAALLAGAAAAHVSETALDGYAFDAKVINDGGLGELEAKALELFTTFCDPTRTRGYFEV